MKFSERWLRTLVDPPIDTATLCDKLTMAGFEVEDVATAAPPFVNVVVGEITRVTPHPDADRLRVCDVDVGRGRTLQIVCGAPNAAVGVRVPCALEGATLPGGQAITRTTMRGIESQGMLCSARELGLGDDTSGLLVLSSDAKPERTVARTSKVPSGFTYALHGEASSCPLAPSVASVTLSPGCPVPRIDTR